MKNILEELSGQFSGTVWGGNGPLQLSRAMAGLCSGQKWVGRPGITECEDVTVFRQGGTNSMRVTGLLLINFILFIFSSLLKETLNKYGLLNLRKVWSSINQQEFRLFNFRNTFIPLIGGPGFGCSMSVQLYNIEWFLQRWHGYFQTQFREVSLDLLRDSFVLHHWGSHSRGQWRAKHPQFVWLHFSRERCPGRFCDPPDCLRTLSPSGKLDPLAAFLYNQLFSFWKSRLVWELKTTSRLDLSGW